VGLNCNRLSIGDDGEPVFALLGIEQIGSHQMNIQEEYLKLLQSPARTAEAVRRIGRENVLLLLDDMKDRGYLREKFDGALRRAQGIPSRRVTQQGRVFLHRYGRTAVSEPAPSPETQRLSALAEKIQALEPALRAGGQLLVSYSDGSTETVRHVSCWYSRYTGSSGWVQIGGEGALLRGLLPYLPFIAEVRLAD
jgi:hypothetical protein